MTEPPLETPAVVADIITIERGIGYTRASVALMSGVTVTGSQAAGDTQALRRLIESLVDVTDSATARVDQLSRHVGDLTAGNRQLRDALRAVLDDVARLRDEKEQAITAASHRVGELMAEVTGLQAELSAAVTVQQAMTPDVAAIIREKEQLRRENGKLFRDNEQLRTAFDTEKRRADTAVAQMHVTEEEAAAAVTNFASLWSDTVHGQLYTKAADAAMAADQAFEDASWKEGKRYLALANTFIGLLNAAVMLAKQRQESGEGT